ncbi:hypothetical protein ACIPY0_12345 [Paenarthrobacter nicotinovorans]
MTATLDPPPDPVPVLTRKLQQLAETLPELFTELFQTKDNQ